MTRLLIVECVVGRLCLRGQDVRLDAVDQSLDLIRAKKLEGILGIGLDLKCLRESPGRSVIGWRRIRKILVVGVGQLRDQRTIARRPQNLRGKAGIDEVLRKRRLVAGLVIIVRRRVLESPVQHIERLLITGSACRSHAARDVVGHRGKLVRCRIAARRQPGGEPARQRRKAGLKTDGGFIRRILEPGHPDPIDGELAEDIAACAEPGDMIRMPMRHDDKCKLRLALRGHLRNRVLDAPEVFRVHPAVDQNMPGAVAGRHRQKKEIAEADPKHANPQPFCILTGRSRYCGGRA